MSGEGEVDSDSFFFGSPRIVSGWVRTHFEKRKQTLSKVMISIAFNSGFISRSSDATKMLSEDVKEALSWYTRRTRYQSIRPEDNVEDTSRYSCLLALLVFENSFVPLTQKFGYLMAQGLEFFDIVFEPFAQLKSRLQAEVVLLRFVNDPGNSDSLDEEQKRIKIQTADRVLIFERLLEVYESFDLLATVSFRRLPLRRTISDPTVLRTGRFSYSGRCKTLQDAVPMFDSIGFWTQRPKPYEESLPIGSKEEREYIESSTKGAGGGQTYTNLFAEKFAKNSDGLYFLQSVYMTDKRYRGAALSLFTISDSGIGHAICPLLFVKRSQSPILVFVNAWHFKSGTVLYLRALGKPLGVGHVFVFPNDAVPNDTNFTNVQKYDEGVGQCQDWSVILAYKFAQAFTFNDLEPRAGAAGPDFSTLFNRVKDFYKALATRDLVSFQREVGLLGG
jgi:hypothetical protein